MRVAAESHGKFVKGLSQMMISSKKLSGRLSAFLVDVAIADGKDFVHCH
jgi:hypothetical protein